MLSVAPLGQVGYLFDFSGTRILIDPYLTDSVAEQFGAHLRRKTAPTLLPHEVVNVSWLLLTHAHLDHCDPASLKLVLDASPELQIAAPYECHPILDEMGVPVARRRVLALDDEWQIGAVRVRVVPAAHTSLEFDSLGRPRFVGFFLQSPETSLYHAGDTIPHPAIFDSLRGRRIDYAFLPINERNYFKDEAGIVGNMSVREAFEFAAKLGALTVIPTHWDLFEANSVFPWEVGSLHDALRPAFALRLLPCGSVYRL